MTGFFDMGGYGGFIWPAWGIAALVLTGLIVASVRAMRTRERELAALEAAAPRRRRRKSAPEDSVADGTESA